MTAAKKGGRAEKAVLSRQEIATKRKALANKKMKAGGAASPARRALAGVFVLAASLLALLAVATFDAHDRVGPGFHNAVGPMGHLIAETLRGALGVCAYFIPVGGIYTAVVLFVGNRERRRLPQIISLALLTCSVAVLSQLMFAKDKGWAHPPGGALGAGLGGLMEGMFSTVGTVILVTAISAAALIVGTQYTFFKLCSLVWAGLTVLGRRISESAHVFWEAQKVSFQARQERLAQEKEEEAAFLAELEAEEEELSEAERLAEEAEEAEAESMAEEAVRLARQTEKEQAVNAKKALKDSREREKLEKKLVREEEPEEDDDDARDEPPSLPPERAERRSPGADPAWAASFLAPQPQLPANTEGAEPPRRARKTPQIVTPPSAPSSPPVPAAALAAPVAEAPAKPLVAEKAEKPLAASPGNALVPAPPSALARMPLIVEPKAPPKPTAVKRPQDQFEFVGDRKSFSLPPLDVLEADKKERTALDKDAFLVTAERLRAKLADFGIVGEVVEIRPGPVVTMYEFLPGPGIKVSKIAALQDDLAMAMEAMRVRIVAPIPGKGVVGIEVPNRDRETVFLKEIAEQDTFQKSVSKLTMCVGKDIEGMPYVFDLVKAPHLLIAGTTGSGKSVAVNAMIMSILLKATPEEVRFIMVDPKMLELSVYEGIPHLLLPVVTDPKKAALALRWAVEEMERRYQLLSEAGVRNIAGYNKLVETSASEVKAAAPAPAAKKKTKPKKLFVVDVEGSTSPASASEGMGVAAPREDDSDELREAIVSEPAPDLEADGEVDAEFEEEGDAPEPVEAAGEAKKELKKLPYIVVIIDELADLMMVASREVETYVARLAQMARAAGIHLMVATQRPSTDVVTGIIKANFPTRISFMLRSKPDSMTILGTVGAEALLGMGDMLIMPPTSAHLQRVHGAYVSEQEIKKAVDHLKAQGKPVFDESILKPRDEDVEGGEQEDELSDELYDQALAAVSEMRSVSISMLQRKMRIGYNRAARMIERMERDGVVGPADGAKPREVLLRGLGDMPGAGAM
ncbi:DNA translocase FtsK 4TM domain-containing protein [Corallococcus sp. bb12-1]|uniref:FtsK/SpoIIIE family DNA translocase n=1 Tax=Corallococcus sp. bb12-1 TaxID=2996784 RepID=UPI0022721BB5|nr:DNA translocase FtsK 4TM domain-containing protein [Corallococcus sp. bb12-1]MCY1043974.1 DNA translocase FtsK 4TM domain-containing protein [Corallococcus sp. bb12-1]